MRRAYAPVDEFHSHLEASLMVDNPTVPVHNHSIGLQWDSSSARRQSIQNFDQAAEILNLDPNTAARLRRPEKIIIVSVPVRMDDGSVEIFTGYRVQHND